MEKNFEVQLAKMEQIIESLKSQFDITLESQRILTNDIKLLSNSISKIENWINHVNDREHKKWVILTIITGSILSIISGTIFNIHHIIRDYTILKEQIRYLNEEIKEIKSLNGIKKNK